MAGFRWFERWTPALTRHHDANAIVVDKPRFLPLLPAEGRPLSVAERLDAAGDWVAAYMLPAGATGIGVLKPAGAEIGGTVEVRARVRTEQRSVVRSLALGDPLEKSLPGPVEGGHGDSPGLALHVSRVRLSGEWFEAGPTYEAAEAEARTGSGSDPGVEGVASALRAAGRLRFGCCDDTSAFRLHEGSADPLGGVTIECFGEFAVLALPDEAAHRAIEPPLASCLMDGGASGVLVKRRARADLRQTDQASLAPRQPLAGEPPAEAIEVHEASQRMLVRLTEGLSTGLFLDQRLARAELRATSHGARVLNLFCYTGSFSVAAGLGGAADVTSVDLSRRALDWARENWALNALPAERHRIIKEDALAWVARARRRGQRFDIVILDPPSFGTRGKRTFSVARDYPTLIADTLELVERGGRLLVGTNHRKTSPTALVGIVRDAARARGIELDGVQRQRLPVDCDPSGLCSSGAKSVLVTVA